MTLGSSFKIKLVITFLCTSILSVLLTHFGNTILAACAIMIGVGFLILISGNMMSRLNNIAELAEKIAIGHNETEIIFDTNDEISSVGSAIKKISEHQQKLTLAASKIAQGDLDTDIQPRNDRDLLGLALRQCQENLRFVAMQIEQAKVSSQEGRLKERCQTDKVAGIYAGMLNSSNNIMDALIQPIGRALKVLNNVTSGDLTSRINGNYNGDHTIFQTALNLTIKTLDDALNRVGTAAEQVAAAAGQISAGSHTLSQGSSEQAGSLEEVSSSLQQVASMTKQNAQNAKEASNLSKVAETSVDAGVESMKRLSEAISRIKSSSDSTAKIIKNIDEIAFQTNLLALNAAVEAARAGDAGKGFAVVAEEVRNLAMRSAEAAKNTASLIEESVKNSENGVALNHEVIENLNGINEQVRKVGAVMTEIAEASEQQTLGVDQVNVVIQKMNRITQQIAANAEESASGSEELSGQSEELKSMVYAFRLSNKIAAADQFSGNHASKTASANTMAQPKKARPRNGNTARKPEGKNIKSISAQAEELIPFGEANPADFRDF